MQSYWLNKQDNNKKLIVFFAGWSFDFNPFLKIEFDNYDVLFVYDYNAMSVPEDLKQLEKYEDKVLVTWSMGVFAAYLHKDLFNDFTCKIAVNGTVTPVDDRCGIPVKVFELTLKHSQKGLEKKFYQNVFLTEEDFNIYMQNPVNRSIENRVSELENLYDLIKNTDVHYEKFYDFAIVSDSDKIIPPANQIESHKQNNVPVVMLHMGHFPFYSFSSWKDIVNANR
ncbi:DUF452 family protein [bacterium]|nr:DUF452 family protein [bacterium]